MIAEEKQHQELIGGINSFKRQSLKRTVSQEKSVLPDRQSTSVFLLLTSAIGLDYQELLCNYSSLLVPVITGDIDTCALSVHYHDSFIMNI